MCITLGFETSQGFFLIKLGRSYRKGLEKGLKWVNYFSSIHVSCAIFQNLILQLFLCCYAEYDVE